MTQIIPIRSHVDGRSSPGASLAVSTASPTSPASTGSPSCKSLGDFWEIHSPKVKPRELVAKLRSMTETIKMLSTENVALREENDSLVMMRGGTSGSLIESHLAPQDVSLITQASEYKRQNISFCFIKMVVLLVTLVGPFWRLAVTLGDLMVPAWDNGDIRAYNMNCTAQCIVLSSSKLMGISGRAMPHTINYIVHELQSR